MKIPQGYISLCIICFLFINCSVHKKGGVSKIYNVDKIVLNGFPSKDTISITFFKKGNWFVTRDFRSRPTEKPLSIPCIDCEKIFTNDFISSLMDLQTEKISSGCRIVKDSVIDGKQTVQITDFYSFSDLFKETISFRVNSKPISIRYLEPRTALPYCKDNQDRLRFIKYSNILRAIR